MKEIQPTKDFYRTFRIYEPDRRCKTCGQIVKSKRPDVKFYLMGISKIGHWKVKTSNRKTINTYHPKYFKEKKLV